MIYELKDTAKVKDLFAGWEETLIYSCLQGVMGKIYVTDSIDPHSACIFVGCFAFYAGVPDGELLEYKLADFTILVPYDNDWQALIEKCYPDARKTVRYAIKKDTHFNIEKLKALEKLLPDGYEMQKIDGRLYDECLKEPFTADFVSSFENKQAFLKNGLGFVIVKDNKIVAGASSYSRYREGIEIEVDTAKDERRKNLATAVCAHLVIECLDIGLYPSWDAQNPISVHLAEKLGYEFSHEYVVYELECN